MFGLTKREQWWKAQQQAGEALAALAAVALRTRADVDIAQAAVDSSELQRAREESKVLLSLLARYYKEVPLGNQPHMIAHEVEAVLRTP